MPGEGLSLHPYDVLAHPKRRRILGLLAEGELTYSELMRRTGIEDSGRLSYHLGVLSHHIRHDGDLYSLSIEGKVLFSAVQEFEKRSYGLMSTMTGSGKVDPEGVLKTTYSFRISFMTPEGNLLERDPGGFNKAKANEMVQSRTENVGLGITGASMDLDENGMTCSFKQEIQAFEEKDGWMVERKASAPATQIEGQENAPPIPGLHMQVRASILYPENAVVEWEPPKLESLEEKGVEVYDLATTDRSLRWRVRKENVVCLGESRLETGMSRTRRIVDMEVHGLAKDTSAMSEVLGQMRDLPVLVSGRTRFSRIQSGRGG